MKQILFINLILLFPALLFAQHDMHNMPGMKMPMEKKEVKKTVQKKPVAKPAAAQTYYTCPMHPEIKKDRSGNCPKCGMALIKKTVKVPSKSTAANSEKKPSAKPTSPVENAHSDDMLQKQEMRDMQSGHEGMNMGNMKDMSASPSGRDDKMQPVSYTCPMHPEIHSTKPGNCPKCGMKLVK
ncbi:MAG: heavy metal-binding domain-containing protein, partial [Ferruginibacter sp.]